MSKKKSKKKLPRNKPTKPVPAKAPPGLLPKHLEDFAQHIHAGSTQRAAAEKIGRSPSSGKYLASLPAVRKRIAEIKEEYGKALISKRVDRTIREIDIDQNDIIMGLADIARDVKATNGARVSAYLGLADIYMLRAKNVRDVRDFYGWNATELREYAVNGTIPARFQLLVGAGESTEEGGTPSFRTAKLPGR